MLLACLDACQLVASLHVRDSPLAIPRVQYFWVLACNIIRLPMHANLRMHAVRLITCMQDVNSTKAIAKSLESAINGHLESAVDVLRYEQCLIARALCQNPRLPGSLAAAIVAMDRNQFHEASLIQ